MSRLGKSCLILFLGTFVTILIAIPILKSKESEFRLKTALNLDKLPKSVQIRKTGGESWTDFLFIAEISVAEEDFRKLLNGRPFRRAQPFDEFYETNWIPRFNPLKIEKQWYWESEENAKYFSSCKIYTNKDYSRIVVTYSGD